MHALSASWITLVSFDLETWDFGDNLISPRCTSDQKMGSLGRDLDDQTVEIHLSNNETETKAAVCIPQVLHVIAYHIEATGCVKS